MKFLIIGNGYIGNYLRSKLPEATLIKNKIFDRTMLKRLLSDGYPGHTLINAAGKTGRPNVDWCESHKEEVFGANVGLPVMIAETCQELKCHWIHIGSGCVYDGYEMEWDEDEEPNFDGSFYARTKAWSQRILEDFDEPLVLRIRMPIDEDMNPRSYISKIVGYAKSGLSVFHRPNSMTMLDDLARAIEHLADRGATGAFNLVNSNTATIPWILEQYKKYVDPDLWWKEEEKEEIEKRLQAKRSDCKLSIGKLLATGFEMPDIRTKIEEVLKKYGEMQRSGNMPKGA